MILLNVVAQLISEVFEKNLIVEVMEIFLTKVWKNILLTDADSPNLFI
jgi:hypothetical protein